MSDEGQIEPPRGGTSQQRAQHMREIDKERRSRVVKLVVALLFVILFVGFIIANSHRVPVDFVFFARESRLVWVFLVCGVVGGLVGYVLGRPSKVQRRIIREAEAEARQAGPE